MLFDRAGLGLTVEDSRVNGERAEAGEAGAENPDRPPADAPAEDDAAANGEPDGTRGERQ